MNHASLPDTFKYLKEVLLVGVTAVVGNELVQWMYFRRKQKAELHKKIEQKKAERKRNVDALLLQIGQEDISEKEGRILELSLDDVLLEMKNRKIKCTEVLRAYQKKALEVTKKLNCVVEFILEAQKLAEQLDEHPDPTSLPLYGLPFSVKLNFAVKGHLKSEGYVRDLYNDVADEEAVTVAALKNLGAVPFVITNVPQTMFNNRTKNPVFGETLNPHDETRSCAGSSGGDAALIGAGGALVGVGTDLGGSIRVPAAFCGNVGLKPTGNRFSLVGVGECVKGLVGLQDNAGFQCRDVDGLITIFKALYHPLSRVFMQKRDVNLPPLGFNQSLLESEQNLCIGYTYGWDEILPVTPVARRAVDIAVEALKAKGHKLIRYDYPDPNKMVHIFSSLFVADGLEQIRKRLAVDIVEEHVAHQLHHLRTPSLVKKVLGWIGKRTNIQCLLPYHTLRGISTEENWDLQYSRSQYIQQVKNSWDAMGLDAVIAPAYPCPALKLDTAGKALMLGQYTAIYNLLDFPAAVVPLTKVNKEDLEELKDYPSHDLLMRQILKSAPGSEGLPMAAQIVALRWKDELVLRLLKEIQEEAKL